MNSSDDIRAFLILKYSGYLDYFKLHKESDNSYSICCFKYNIYCWSLGLGSPTPQDAWRNTVDDDSYFAYLRGSFE